jgi:hypothetical protein
MNPNIDDITAFRTRLRGELITPDDAGYDAARIVWNATIDRRPGRRTDEAKQQAAAELVRRKGLVLGAENIP